MLLVSDGADVTGLPDGDHLRWEGTPVVLDQGVSRTPGGAIAGSTATLLDGIRVLVASGVDLGTALHASSTAPADSLGDRAIGRIEPGASADLVLLDDELAIHEVVVQGVTENS